MTSVRLFGNKSICIQSFRLVRDESHRPHHRFVLYKFVLSVTFFLEIIRLLLLTLNMVLKTLVANSKF